VGFSGNARWLPGGFGGRRGALCNRREALGYDLHEASGLRRRVPAVVREIEEVVTVEFVDSAP
jgi:hypothetical protein